MPDFVNELKLDVLVLDLHNFCKALPPSVWKNRDRAPLQTIKTILTTLEKLRSDLVRLFCIPLL